MWSYPKRNEFWSDPKRYNPPALCSFDPIKKKAVLCDYQNNQFPSIKGLIETELPLDKTTIYKERRNLMVEPLSTRIEKKVWKNREGIEFQIENEYIYAVLYTLDSTKTVEDATEDAWRFYVIDIAPFLGVDPFIYLEDEEGAGLLLQLIYVSLVYASEIYQLMNVYKIKND